MNAIKGCSQMNFGLLVLGLPSSLGLRNMSFGLGLIWFSWIGLVSW